MLRHRVLALVALWALSASAGMAETELEMEQVVVTATRTPTTILDSPDNVTVVTGEELAAGGALTAAEALAKVAGVEIADSGTVGSVKSVRIRGAASAQVLVLVDGVRMNDSRQGATDLSLLPVEMIERIEIVRGGTSALYGADAMGGVVNIITKSRAQNHLTLSVSNGSYIPHAAVEVSEGPTQTPVDANWLDLADTQRIGLQVSGTAGPVDLLVTGSFTRAANGFVWNDTQYIGAWRRQVNSGLLEGNTFLSATSRADAATLGFKGQFDYSSTRVPGWLTWPYTDAAQQRAYLQGQLFYTNPSLTRRFGLEARVYYKLTRLAYQNPDPFFPENDTHTLHSAGVELQQQASFVDFLQLVYGGSFLADFAESTSIGNRRRLSGGAFLEVPLYLGERFILTPVARYDLYSDFPGSLTWKVGAVMKLSDTLSLKASGGKSYKAPTLNDLYWPDVGWGIGNPDLKPETGYSGEIGLSHATDRLEVTVSAFVRYVRDGIQWDLAAIPNTPVNIGEALYPGAEASLDIELLPGLSLSGSYTFLYSFVLKGASATYTFEDDKRAVYSPVHTADAALRYENGKTRLGIDASFAGERFTDEANTTSLPAYVVLNADARQRLSPNLAVSLAAKNLLNTVYQSVSGYIMPPISFWLGLEMRY
jgi:outer membrane receptor for ferrienterochelin and colicins